MAGASQQPVCGVDTPAPLQAILSKSTRSHTESSTQNPAVMLPEEKKKMRSPRRTAAPCMTQSPDIYHH